MLSKQKLELTWIGKNDQPVLEPRILIEDPEKSYGDPNSENMLIFGDNLLALKALEQNFTGKIKCIYIDPPYNTGKALENYDDNLEHSIWLNLMKPRLEILKKLMNNEGFICCHIDDSEGHYLKVLMDEIFGRENYLTTLFIRVRYPDKTLTSDMYYHKEIEQVYIYRKQFGPKPNFNTEISNFEKFKYHVVEKNSGTETIIGNKKVIIFKNDEYEIEEREGSEYGLKEIWASGAILDGNSSGRFFRDYLTGRYDFDGYGVLYKVHGIGDDRYEYRYFTGPKRIGATKGKYFQGVPVYRLGNENQIRELPINNFYDLAANFGNCRNEGGVEFRSGKKPEALLKLIVFHFSDENSWILDSFLGSGTTAAVAHKMHRKYIGIEIKEHCHTHCLPRLRNVINGSDQTGITSEVQWKGGDGFKYYSLAPSLLKQDKYGNWIIDELYNADMLAAAMAKHEGFKYMPDVEVFWKQGQSTEKDFIFTTTTFVTVEYLGKIHEEMREDESLLICCRSFQKACKNRYPNITVKKIPNMLLGRCEFGKEDYSLNIVNLPSFLEETDESPEEIVEAPGANAEPEPNQMNLFNKEGGR